MKAAIFFERDGVLNLCDPKNGVQVAPNRMEQFRVNPDALKLLQELKKAGFILIATTNQPGITHGEVTRSEVDLMHAVLRRKLPLDDIMLCASDDPSHPCMKPNPGMFIEAAFKWSLDLDQCYVISDKWQDAKAAQVAGCTSIMIRSPWIGTDHHDFVVGSLTEAVARLQQFQASTMARAAAGA